MKQEAPAGGCLAMVHLWQDKTVPNQERDCLMWCHPLAAFLRDLAAALHLDHGTAVINLHGGGPGAVSSLGRLLGRGQSGPGYVTDNPAGAAVETISRAYRCAHSSHVCDIDHS